MPANNTVNKNLYVAFTPRILLRTLSVAEHLEDYHRIWSDPRALIWSTQSPKRTVADSKAWMIQWAKAYRPEVDNYAVLLRQYSTSALEAYPCLRMIGTVGVIRQPPELGYMIHPDYWGKGYAGEAVQAFLQYYWQLRPETKSIIAKVDTENEASVRILVKNGFREEELCKQDIELPGRGPRDMVVYRLTREEAT